MSQEQIEITLKKAKPSAFDVLRKGALEMLKLSLAKEAKGQKSPINHWRIHI